MIFQESECKKFKNLNIEYHQQAYPNVSGFLSSFVQCRYLRIRLGAHLDTFHPGARIMELRRMGHNIITALDTIVDTKKVGHRITSYVFLATV